MNKLTLKTAALALSMTLAGCSFLQPALPGAQAEIPAQFGQAGSAGEGAAEQAGASAVADVGWRNFFTDPKLEAIIADALARNRDLRVAALNVERTRAAYQVQRADRLPSVGVNLSGDRSGGSAAATSNVYSASLGIAAFELDLFGRVRNLTDAALQQYLAQGEARRSVQLSLIAEIANIYLTLAADLESQRVAQATLDTQQALFDLIGKRHTAGAVSGLDIEQARTTVESARADVAYYAGRVATGKNYLNLLAGRPVPADRLPERFDLAVSGLQALPAGLPSEVLLRRPDVRQAEHLLRSANANIGAARAAFFPSISLTGSIGSASNQLSGLFESGTRVWGFMPSVSLPIFEGGRLRAQLGVATADRDIALARYEQSIQAGFRDVADALALTRTLAARRDAQQALLQAAERTHRLSKERYDRGRDSYLVLLDAQRTLYAAQQGLVAAQLAEQSNRIVLYRVLGGGWNEGRDGA
ncbi:efflux transporter outer membrane subunit [Massilia niabensis]|uniref:Efflux transporter outer membrane subunit n=1 Tax=Massilia niabensis TaxID=544910 RepID=A0ABW0KZQ4_9BURK